MSEGHIRPRGKGAWELKYDVGLDPLTGRRVTKYATIPGWESDLTALVVAAPVIFMQLAAQRVDAASGSASVDGD